MPYIQARDAINLKYGQRGGMKVSAGVLRDYGWTHAEYRVARDLHVSKILDDMRNTAKLMTNIEKHGSPVEEIQQ